MDINQKLDVVIGELKAVRNELMTCMDELNAAMIEKHSGHVSEYFKRKAFGDGYRQFIRTPEDLIQIANDTHAFNKSKGWTND